MSKRLITILTPCYNEELNVRELYRRVLADGCWSCPSIVSSISSSTMHRRTARWMCCRAMAAEDPSVKVIVNARNFGPDRSGMHGFLQAAGDAVGSLAADMQDPPELFVEMIREWETGLPHRCCDQEFER